MNTGKILAVVLVVAAFFAVIPRNRCNRRHFQNHNRYHHVAYRLLESLEQ